MKKLTIGIIMIACVMGLNTISFADTQEQQEQTNYQGIPSWAYESNDNIPAFVDKDGNQIPNIIISENMVLVDVYGKWWQEAITYCGKQGYLEDMLIRKVFFNPRMEIDKCDLTILLGRMESIEYSKYTKEYFSDITMEDYDLSGTYDYTDWYKNLSPYYVNWAGEEGILKGSSQGKLNNMNGMNREEAATIIDRYISKKTTLYQGAKFDEDLNYKDSHRISNWAKESVGRLSKLNLFNGDQNGHFNPKESISRAEICQVIFNMSQLEASN